MLHNICKDRNLPVPADEEEDHGEDDGGGANHESPMPQPHLAGCAHEGLLCRDEYVNLHFKQVINPR